MEIERKYLINRESIEGHINLNKLKRKHIKQVYLSTNNPEIRVREIIDNNNNEKYVMTIKSKGDLEREEVEFEIPKNKFRDIIGNKMYVGQPIIKTRYELPIEDDLVIEIDCFNNLFPLMLAEIEFSSIAQANSFNKPNWLGLDVTCDKRYKNKNLAIQGL